MVYAFNAAAVHDWTHSPEESVAIIPVPTQTWRAVDGRHSASISVDDVVDPSCKRARPHEQTETSNLMDLLETPGILSYLTTNLGACHTFCVDERTRCGGGSG